MRILHAHVESESADCDGRYSRTYTYSPDPWAEQEDDFINQVLVMTVSTFTDSGSLKVTQDLLKPESKRLPRFEWSEDTEEGFSHSVVTFCLDPDCADAPATQRDHSAEAAGY